MFENLSDRLNTVFRNLRGQGRLNEKNIQDGLREVRLALLEADVHFKVVKDFVARIKERALGQDVLQSLTPGQQVVKIVHDEMITLLGGQTTELDLACKPPVVIMLVGLQGSGKTTSAAKLALHLRRKKYEPYLVPADVYRPAAIDQLTKLGAELKVPVFASSADMKPVDICRQALAQAEKAGAGVVILDTAGRLHIDEELMRELEAIKAVCNPQEILLVADAMTGQDAVNVATHFNEHLDISGIVLTKMEGDARGGAALSITNVTQKPIKFIGVGEKLSELEVFHPDRVASRILGMGDVLTLIEKAQASLDEKEARELQGKLEQADFTLEDFRQQMRKLKKLGSLEGLMKLVPGMGKMKEQLKDARMPDKELAKVEAIISSMTPQERLRPKIINASRKIRIAKGSGVEVQDVNSLLRNFEQMRKMMKKMMGNMKKGKRMPGLPGMPGMPALATGGGRNVAALKSMRKKMKKKRKK